jgi:hypothetical protein
MVNALEKTRRKNGGRGSFADMPFRSDATEKLAYKERREEIKM